MSIHKRRQRYLSLRAVLRSTICLAMLLSGCSRSRPATKGPNELQNQSLYQRLGGVEVLRRLVDEWFLEVATDPRIRDFFAGADIARLKLRMVEKLCVLIQGPCVYRGGSLREAHAALAITSSHMSVFLADLGPALQTLEVGAQPAAELEAMLERLGSRLLQPTPAK